MLDKEWLERVSLAYKIYQEQYGKNQEITNFISWLYKQYGIVEIKKD